MVVPLRAPPARQRGDLSRAAAVTIFAVLIGCTSKPEAEEAAAPPASPRPTFTAVSTELPGPLSARPHLARSNDIDGIRHFLLGITLYDVKKPIWTLDQIFHKSEPPGLKCNVLG